MQKVSDPDQTPRSAASDLVYTVCQCPFYETLGINRLKEINNQGE